MKIVRTYIFSGSPEWIDAVLTRSLPDGLTMLGADQSIQVGTVVVNEIAETVSCKAHIPNLPQFKCQLTRAHTQHRTWPDENLGGSYTWEDGDAEATFQRPETPL